MVHGTVEGPASSQPSSTPEVEESTRFLEIPRSTAPASAEADRDLLGMLAPAELTFRMSPAAKRGHAPAPGIALRPMLPPHNTGDVTRIGFSRPASMPAPAATASAWPPPESLRVLPEPIPVTPRVVAFVTSPLEPGTLVAEPAPVTVRDSQVDARAQDAHYGRWAAGFLLTLGALFVVSLFVPHGTRHAAAPKAPASVASAAAQVQAPAAPALAAAPPPPAFTIPTAVVITADVATPPAEPKAPAVAPPVASVRPAGGRLVVIAEAPHRPGGRRMAEVRTPKSVPMTPAEIEQFKRDPHGYMKHLEP